MAQVTFQGSPISTNGNLPAIGQVAPDFTLVAADLSEKSLANFAGKRKVLNISLALTPAYVPSPSALSTNAPLLWTIPSSCAFLPIYRLHKPVSAAQKV